MTEQGVLFPTGCCPAVKSHQTLLVALLFALAGCPRVETAAEPSVGAKEQRQAEAPGASGECPQDMVHIPGGTFMAGTAKDDELDPLHKVTLTKSYCIDRTEVTLEAYHRCQAAGACTKSGGGGPQCNEDWPERDKHPVNCVTWFQAEAYCRWAKKRLPSAAEWEFAARGPDSLRFPWGNEPPTLEQSWSGTEKMRHGTTEAGSLPKGASPFGVLDMGGNLSEWVQDWSEYPPSAEDKVDPSGAAESAERCLKDFGWDAGALGLMHMGRTKSLSPDYSGNSTGFRCAQSIPPR